MTCRSCNGTRKILLLNSWSACLDCRSDPQPKALDPITDPETRAREGIKAFSTAVSLPPVAGSREEVIQALSAIPGVRSAVLLDTETPHIVAPVVDGGDATAIAEALDAELPFHTATIGTIARQIGRQTVYFSRPVRISAEEYAQLGSRLLRGEDVWEELKGRKLWNVP